MAIGFVVACKKYFGFKSEQKIAEFQTELKTLSDKDKEELRPMLAEALGEEVLPWGAQP